MAEGMVRVELGGAEAFQNNISQKNTYMYFARYVVKLESDKFTFI
jgi:hypothetical protein